MTHVLIDEETIDESIGTIQSISFSNPPRCGNGSPNVCINDDLANVGNRTILFTRGNNITPYNGLVLPTGETKDEGIFVYTLPDPQTSLQNGATFTKEQFFTASGAAANENNLDKIAGVSPLRTPAQINALVGQTLCAVVFDGSISITGTNPDSASLKGATLGVTAFTVTATTNDPPRLPKITINILPSDQVLAVCTCAP